MSARLLAPLAAILGFTGVALGAFGAHGLEQSVTAARLAAWETGVQYQLVHALALLALGLAPPRSGIAAVGWLFVVGTLVFSGTLYALVLFDAPWLGMVTPVGGVLLLLGWGALFFALLRRG